MKVRRAGYHVQRACYRARHAMRFHGGKLASKLAGVAAGAAEEQAISSVKPCMDIKINSGGYGKGLRSRRLKANKSAKLRIARSLVQSPLYTQVRYTTGELTTSAGACCSGFNQTAAWYMGASAWGSSPYNDLYQYVREASLATQMGPALAGDQTASATSVGAGGVVTFQPVAAANKDILYGAPYSFKLVSSHMTLQMHNGGSYPAYVDMYRVVCRRTKFKLTPFATVNSTDIPVDSTGLANKITIDNTTTSTIGSRLFDTTGILQWFKILEYKRVYLASGQDFEIEFRHHDHKVHSASELFTGSDSTTTPSDGLTAGFVKGLSYGWAISVQSGINPGTGLPGAAALQMIQTTRNQWKFTQGTSNIRLGEQN